MTVSPEITHEGLCGVDGCPWPSDPDMHIPWCSHGLVGHHQHIPKRSQDTKAKIQAFICPRCHDKIDNGLWSNHIKTFPDGSVHYFILDEHGKTKTDRVVGQAHPHDPLLPAQVESEPHPYKPPMRVVYMPTSLEFPDDLTYEEWTQVGLFLAGMTQSMPWWIGDWLLAGEFKYGEKFAQAASETGLKEERLQQYQWVSEHIQSCTRAQFSGLYWTHFRQVAHLDTEKQQEWLQRAQDENLTTSELHLAIHAKELPAGPECPDAEDGQHHYLTMCANCGHLR